MESNDSANPKDSLGDRKPPLHLIPPSAEILESLALRHGAITKGYGVANWRTKSPRVSVYVGACRRHLAAWFDGEEHDGESGISHLGHARACLAILIDALSLGRAIDDRPPPGKAAELIARFTSVAEPDDEIGDLIEVDELTETQSHYLRANGWTESLQFFDGQTIWRVNSDVLARWPAKFRTQYAEYAETKSWCPREALALQVKIGEELESIREEVLEHVEPQESRSNIQYLRTHGWEFNRQSPSGVDIYQIKQRVRDGWPEKLVTDEEREKVYWEFDEAFALQARLDATPVVAPADGDSDRYGRGTESPHAFLEEQPSFGEPPARTDPPTAKPVLGRDEKANIRDEKANIRDELYRIFDEFDNGCDGDGMHALKKLAEQLK